jgi:translation initiation factor IF-2
LVVNPNFFWYAQYLFMPNKPENNLVRRSPVVVIMGHIDHGKSTLLDYIRKTNVVAGEAGGITQHVGAYEAEYASADGKKHTITFLDTPGHEAFCNIRERGAQAADVAILVVSAEDGVKPQTVEAYKNIKESKLPFIVAITKIDKPNANVERVKQSLGENEIYIEGWGGDVPFVAISAVTGEGIPELLDMVLLVSELNPPQTDPTALATGVIIESTLDTRKGVSATLLIKNGTLELGTFVVADGSYAPVRFIENFKGEKIEKATASMPVRILGWTTIPACGGTFTTLHSKKIAEKFVEEYESKVRQAKSKPAPVVTPVKQPTDGAATTVEETPSVVSLPIVIKADVIGSLEGVKYEMKKILHDRVQIKIVSEGIGDINENDVKTAQSDPSILIVGFNVEADKKARAMIERSAVPLNVKSFTIIYELAQYVRSALEAKIPKEYVEEMTGRAKILALFSHEKDRQVIGGKVESGIIESGNDVRIMRRDSEIGRGKIRELQSKKQRVGEVAEGFEFGMLVEAKIEIAPGDKVEAVRTVEKK